VLPTPAPNSIANYVGSVQTGKLLFLSGKGPDLAGAAGAGKLGRTTHRRGLPAARDTMPTSGGSQGKTSDLLRVIGVKCTGMVNSAPTHRSAEGHQRRVGSAGRGLWRSRPARALAVGNDRPAGCHPVESRVIVELATSNPRAYEPVRPDPDQSRAACATGGGIVLFGTDGSS